MDTIEIAASMNLRLDGTDGLFEADGLDVLTGTVILQGSVMTPTVLDGGGRCRVLHVHEGVTAILSGLTVRGGYGLLIADSGE